jgi:predicted nucleic acid-binding protein
MELSEILQGTRGEEERNEVEETMSVLPLLANDISTWKKIGQISSVLMRKGVTIPLTDLFIGVITINNNCQVFTLDKHFEKIPEISLYVPDGKSQPGESLGHP